MSSQTPTTYYDRNWLALTSQFHYDTMREISAQLYPTQPEYLASVMKATAFTTQCPLVDTEHLLWYMDDKNRPQPMFEQMTTAQCHLCTYQHAVDNGGQVHLGSECHEWMTLRANVLLTVLQIAPYAVTCWDAECICRLDEWVRLLAEVAHFVKYSDASSTAALPIWLTSPPELSPWVQETHASQHDGDMNVQHNDGMDEYDDEHAAYQQQHQPHHEDYLAHLRTCAANAEDFDTCSTYAQEHYAVMSHMPAYTNDYAGHVTKAMMRDWLGANTNMVPSDLDEQSRQFWFAPPLYTVEELLEHPPPAHASMFAIQEKDNDEEGSEEGEDDDDESEDNSMHKTDVKEEESHTIRRSSLRRKRKAEQATEEAALPPRRKHRYNLRSRTTSDNVEDHLLGC